MSSQTKTSKFSPLIREAINSVSDEEMRPYYKKLQSVAELLKERRSSIPFYARNAKREKEETGDEMNYWRDLATSCINLA